MTLIHVSVVDLTVFVMLDLSVRCDLHLDGVNGVVDQVVVRKLLDNAGTDRVAPHVHHRAEAVPVCVVETTAYHRACMMSADRDAIEVIDPRAFAFSQIRAKTGWNMKLASKIHHKIYKDSYKTLNAIIA